MAMQGDDLSRKSSDYAHSNYSTDDMQHPSSDLEWSRPSSRNEQSFSRPESISGQNISRPPLSSDSLAMQRAASQEVPRSENLSSVEYEKGSLHTHSDQGSFGPSTPACQGQCCDITHTHLGLEHSLYPCNLD